MIGCQTYANPPCHARTIGNQGKEASGMNPTTRERTGEISWIHHLWGTGTPVHQPDWLNQWLVVYWERCSKKSGKPTYIWHDLHFLHWTPRNLVCKVYLYCLHMHRIWWSCEGLMSISQQIHWINWSIYCWDYVQLVATKSNVLLYLLCMSLQLRSDCSAWWLSGWVNDCPTVLYIGLNSCLCRH